MSFRGYWYPLQPILRYGTLRTPRWIQACKEEMTHAASSIRDSCSRACFTTLKNHCQRPYRGQLLLRQHLGEILRHHLSRWHIARECSIGEASAQSFIYPPVSHSTASGQIHHYTSRTYPAEPLPTYLYLSSDIAVLSRSNLLFARSESIEIVIPHST